VIVMAFAPGTIPTLEAMLAAHFVRVDDEPEKAKAKRTDA
jgi:hypothetical protein